MHEEAAASQHDAHRSPGQPSEEVHCQAPDGGEQVRFRFYAKAVHVKMDSRIYRGAVLHCTKSVESPVESTCNAQETIMS